MQKATFLTRLQFSYTAALLQLAAVAVRNRIATSLKHAERPHGSLGETLMQRSQASRHTTAHLPR